MIECCGTAYQTPNVWGSPELAQPQPPDLAQDVPAQVMDNPPEE